MGACPPEAAPAIPAGRYRRAAQEPPGAPLETRPDVIDEDIRRARTLPASFYRDPAIFERLREKVFARSWQLADGAEQVSGAGSVLPFTFLAGCVDEPLLLARDSDGGLHGLSNVCTHRGNLLCTKAEVAQSLRCRYHGRRFALDGRFLSMPEFEGVSDFSSPADDVSPDGALMSTTFRAEQFSWVRASAGCARAASAIVSNVHSLTPLI